jgi:phosphomannomutase
VAGVTDFREGAAQRPPWLGATPLVALDLGTAGRALVRPSGTEPKLKIYVDGRAPLGPGDDLARTEAAALEAAGAVAADLAGFLRLA